MADPDRWHRGGPGCEAQGHARTDAGAAALRGAGQGEAEWGEHELLRLITRIKNNYIHSGREIKQAHIRDWIARISTTAACSVCGGARLGEKARASKIDGYGIAQLSALQVSDLIPVLDQLQIPDAAPLLGNLKAVLRSMVQIGLGYISLDRPAGTLSGGEAQRVKMIRHLGSALSDVTYVFDEPRWACTRTTSSG